MQFYANKKSRIIILIVTLVLTVGLLVSSFFVKTNYDMTKYLDSSSNTYQGIEILEDTFGNYAAVELMTEDLTIAEALTLKADIKALENVMNVIFIDDFVDVTSIPIEFVPEEVKAPFISGNKMKFQIVFTKDVYDEALDKTIDDIRALTDGYMRGEALDNSHARQVANNQLILIMAIIVPICIVILIIASKSYVEVLLILGVLGVAIVFNQGTNLFLGSISFITMTMGMALQLAMSLDYSLFLIHRYHEFRHLGKKEAIKAALKGSLKSITASSLTTVFGFIALTFMQYKIGFDIGFVLAKGIIFSYLSVIILMPIGLYYLDGLITKTTHKSFLPNMKSVGTFVYKFKLPLSLLLVAIAGFGFYFSNKSIYLYQGTQSQVGSQLYIENEKIEEAFGPNNPIVILIKGQDAAKESILVSELKDLDDVLNIDALVKIEAQYGAPRAFLPPAIVENFVSGDYIRIILNTSLNSESEAYFKLDADIREITSQHFDEAYYVGVIPSTSDIKEMVTNDTILVLILSIGLVFLVIMFVFKSVLIPTILVVIIEASIWFNLGINAVGDTPILYIGYLIIMSIQLGATIDYAVLLSSRYLEERETKDKKEALIDTVKASMPTIIISAFILATAGFIEFFVSDMNAIKEIGLLLGRGTIIAFMLTIFTLPPYLYFFDKWLVKKKKENVS